MPPDTGRIPAVASATASARALSTTCRAYARKEGPDASRKATALAAIACIIGPPWLNGKTALSTRWASSARHRIMPPRGPRSTLWVVQVTTSAYGTGDGIAFPATRPMKCAASTRRYASTSSAISRNSAKSITRGYAVAPQMISLGRWARARSRTSS